MATRGRRWVPIALGVAFVLVCLVIGLVLVVASVFRQNVDVATVDAPRAVSAFDEIRHRYGARPPLFEMRDGRPYLVPAERAGGPAARLAAVHILAWDPDDGHLARVSIPFWLIRLKGTPIDIRNFGSDGDLDSGADLTVSAEQLEAHGPGVVFDHTSADGDRVLVWLE